MAENKFRSLVAELAQLITQPDPFEDRAPTDSRFRGKTAWKRYDEPLGLLLAPQQLADLNAREQAREFGEYRHDDGAYAVDDQPCAAREEYQKEAPRVRRTRGSVITIVGLALLGAAGAFGYREMFGGSVLPTPPPTITTSTEPHKVAPTASTNRGDASQVGADITGSIEKLVSREEQPVTIAPPKSAPRRSLPRVSVPAATGQAVANQAMPHVAAAADPRGPPPTIAIPSQRAGQSGAADVTAAANRARVAAALAPAAVNSTAAVTPPVIGSRYAVQVTSERSESNAQAALQALQAKYPNQLSGRQPIIRRADLGAKGTYYRVLVGPFASAEEAAGLCSRLKAAGGNCIVQRN
jgi:SPOR domain